MVGMCFTIFVKDPGHGIVGRVVLSIFLKASVLGETEIKASLNMKPHEFYVQPLSDV